MALLRLQFTAKLEAILKANVIIKSLIQVSFKLKWSLEEDG